MPPISATVLCLGWVDTGRDAPEPAKPRGLLSVWPTGSRRGCPARSGGEYTRAFISAPVFSHDT
jgi:hypothetical protein